ncbi:MAG: metallophosphoesterase [Myxococcaceae bacterium]
MILALRIVFSLVMLSLMVGAHLFLHRRLLRDPKLPRWSIRALYGTFAFLAGAAVITLVMRRGGETYGLILPMWIALVLNMLLVFVPLEVVQRVRRKLTPEVSEERRVFLTRAIAAGGAVAGGGFTVFGAYRAYEPAQIEEVVVRLRGLPKALEGFTLAHLSDIHIGRVLQRRYLDALVDRTNSLKADLVAITGDLVDGTTQQLGPIVSRLGNLRSKYGTHFVTGNHDYYSGADEWVYELKKLGIRVLRNERVAIGDSAASFDLIGVDDWGHGGLESDYDLDSAVSGRDDRRASVLLAHQPSNFDVVSEEHRLGLQLSGHTHGGQMFPATLIGQMIWGERNAGLSRHGDSQLFVSRGCGFVGPAQRMGSPPEIAKVILVPA